MPAGAPGSRYDVVVTASRDGRSDEARLRDPALRRVMAGQAAA